MSFAVFGFGDWACAGGNEKPSMMGTVLFAERGRSALAVPSGPDARAEPSGVEDVDDVTWLERHRLVVRQ